MGVGADHHCGGVVDRAAVADQILARRVLRHYKRHSVGFQGALVAYLLAVPRDRCIDTDK